MVPVFDINFLSINLPKLFSRNFGGYGLTPAKLASRYDAASASPKTAAPPRSLLLSADHVTGAARANIYTQVEKVGATAHAQRNRIDRSRRLFNLKY